MKIIAKEDLQPTVAPTLCLVVPIEQQQPLVEPATLGDQPDVEPDKVELHLRLVDDVPVLLHYEPRILDLSARFDKMKWEFYEPIAEGFHRLIAKLTKLDINDVRISQTLRIVQMAEKEKGTIGEGDKKGEIAKEGTASMEGSPRLVIRLPVDFKKYVTSREFRYAIASFLYQVKNGKPGKTRDLLPVDGEIDELVLSEETTDAVREIAQQVISVVGGRTLPGACVVESPLWKNNFELRGILAPKPEINPDPSEDVPMMCGVDGYRKRTRVVYLFPNFPANAASIEVSFDEKEWLETIKDAAALEGQLFNARFDEVKTGTKIKRKLTALAKTDGDDDLLAN